MSLLPTGHQFAIVPHRFEGLFSAEGVSDVFLTKNLLPGQAVYNRVVVQNEDGTQVEYKIWNSFSSKLAAAIFAHSDNIHIKPGSKVLYLGTACGATISLLSDIVGPSGLVYAVGCSNVSGPDLVNMAAMLTNVIPIIEDPRYPAKYVTLVGMVDVIYSDIAQPDQTKILGLNASHYLKTGGHFVLSFKTNCIDSTQDPESVTRSEVRKLKKEQFNPREQTTLLSEADHYVLIGGYKMTSLKVRMLDAQLQDMSLRTLEV
ncbi:rRNA 2'-O-methyltransferase fibrillarin 1-like [Lotus japonicus]|uniref:rRNA 2'-O-methyltransferase fibrillarin 1-like n=1 Tax=Lotus japonicus TaxID=34305 RepID=UPI00258F5EAC|nr:rRNA 2'-O-methyltransferase fibrillarin 1-like [Lotus japonicus]